ncbi:MAG: TRAP transporter permease [Ectothiorhodospiraceae bacterium]|nr:TRAP transporter permease [Ectothiorhodospiraceae bacterium]
MSSLERRTRAVAHTLFLLVGIVFFVWLFNYYWTGLGGPVLLACTMVPVTFVLFTLDALRKGEFYPRLGPVPNIVIAVVYITLSLGIAAYLYVEFIPIGEERAGFWNRTDLTVGALMVLLVMEYARTRYLPLFLINIALVLYAVYGSVVPGMFHHGGLSWTRLVGAMSVEMSTGVFSGLPQLALTLIGSFVLVLSALRAFGCVDSILKGANQIAVRSPNALPQAAVVGSLGVAAVSGSGAANAVTTGSATIPAMINAGMPRATAAAIESAASLGGQLMPPIMGISAFLMAEFLGRSYFDVVARGYVPALIYFAAIALSVYLMSIQYRIRPDRVLEERMERGDWINLAAFVLVIVGLVICMAYLRLPAMFAALYVFLAVLTVLALRMALDALRAGESAIRRIASALVRFLDIFTAMTAELTLLLATLAILTGALVVTGIPTKIGFILLDAAGVNLWVMGVVAFLFGALLGMGLPPAPTYILTALVIAPPMIKAGMDPWAVHFFAFFIGVWGELTPPTSVVAAVTAKIAEASFMRTLMHALKICSSLFVLMIAMFSHPELVQEPGAAQLGAMVVVLVATAGLTFALQATFLDARGSDLLVRLALAAVALVVLCYPDRVVAYAACLPVVAAVAWWVVHRRPRLQEPAPA